MQVPPNCDLTLGLRCVDKNEPGVSVWEMRADERFANPAGIVQGGFVGALCDSAMGASSVTWVIHHQQGRKVFSANAEMKVSFLKAAKVGSMLTCTARVVSGGEKVVFVEAEVVDDANRTVARASSTYVLSPRG